MTDSWSVQAQAWKKNNLPPLQPDGPELGLIIRWMQQFKDSGQDLHALLLGVTSEYCTLPWPQNSNLLAVDHSQSMIDKVWQGAKEQVLCADWLDMPLSASSRNFVLCDGGLCLQAYPQSQQQLVRAVARVMQPGGIALIRCFVLPEKMESITQVMQDLLAGAINNICELKLRLWVVLQQSKTEGTSSRQLWNTVQAVIPDWTQLALLLKADAAYLQEASSTAPVRKFYFTQINEIIDWFCIRPGGFILEEIVVPPHALGAHCPTLVLRRL